MKNIFIIVGSIVWTSTICAMETGIGMREQMLDRCVSAVAYGCPGYAHIQRGPVDKITIHAEEHLLPLFKIEQIGEQLSVSLIKNNDIFRSKKPVKVIVELSEKSILNTLRATTSGDINVDPAVLFDDHKSLIFEIQSSGKIALEQPLTTQGNVTLETKGSGDIVCTGNVRCSEYYARGKSSGHFYLGNIDGYNVTINLEGTGNINASTIHAQSHYAATTLSSGKFCFNTIAAATAELALKGTGDFKAQALRIGTLLKAQSGSSGAFKISGGSVPTAHIILNGTGNFEGKNFHVENSTGISENSSAILHGKSSGNFYLRNISTSTVDINLGGTGDFTAQDILAPNNFSLVSHSSGHTNCTSINTTTAALILKGTGDFAAQALIINKLLKAQSNSSGAFKIGEGHVPTATIHLGGTGDFKGKNFNIENELDARGTSSGYFHCKASGTITGSLTGSGDFNNYTSCKQLSLSTKGSGKYKQK